MPERRERALRLAAVCAAAVSVALWIMGNAMAAWEAAALPWARLWAALVAFLLMGYACARRRKVQFLQITAGAALCLLLAELYTAVYIWVREAPPQGFTPAQLSRCGFYLFLFSGDFGALDSLADDGSPGLRSYRYLPLLWPVCAAGALVWCVLLGAEPVSTAALFTALGVCGYWALKLRAIPDEELGFVRPLRRYHALVMTAVILQTVRALLEAAGLPSAGDAAALGVCLAALFLPAEAEGGVRLWYT